MITGGGILKDGDRSAGLLLALACTDNQRPTRLELIWRSPANRDPKDRDDRRADWDWDDRQWDDRDWSTRDWKDRDWDDHNWDDRDRHNWGRKRGDNRGNGRDTDEKRGGWGRFHLVDATAAQCTNDPAIANSRWDADFDTQRGTGRGRLADGSAATVEWTLVDGGWPGQRDRVTLKVRDSGGKIVFEISDTLTPGRLEAHNR
jgi:hypothetical protein